MLIKYCIKLRLIKKRFYDLNFVTSGSCLQAYIIFYKFRGCVNILNASFTNFEDKKLFIFKKKYLPVIDVIREDLGYTRGFWFGETEVQDFPFLLFFFLFIILFFWIEHNCFNRRKNLLFFYKKVILFKRERERERER